MGATGAIVGLGAFQAGTQLMGGFMANREAKQNANYAQDEAAYNAGIYRQQVGMVENQKQLKAAQDARKIRFVEGQHTAVTASKGITMSGTPNAILIDTMTQMEMDKAITSYNYDMEKYTLESQARSTEYRGATLASAYRQGGKTAMIQGVIGGMSTLAGTAMYAYGRTYPSSYYPKIPSSSYGSVPSPRNYYTPLNSKNVFNTSGGVLSGGAV